MLKLSPRDESRRPGRGRQRSFPRPCEEQHGEIERTQTLASS